MTRRHIRELAREAVHVLPRGASLPDDVWSRRHRGILTVLWLHVPAIVLFAVAMGDGVLHGILEGGIIALIAGAATLVRDQRRATTILTAVGLLSCSAVLVHLSGGVIELHFHFFVMVGVVVLYQDWWPFLFAIAYVVLHHAVVGTLSPESVYNHPAAIANPAKWALVHGGFIMGMSAAGIAAWRLNEAFWRGVMEREQQLAEAQEVAHLGSWEWDFVNDRVAWSDEQYRLFGVSPDVFDPTVAGFLSYVHPDDRGPTQQAIEEISEDPRAFAFDFRRVLPDGSVRWLHARGDLVSRDDRRPARLCGTVQDITERKQAEEAVRDSERRYRTIVETAHEGVWMLDADNRTTFANGRMAAMLGYRLDEMVGRPLERFLQTDAEQAAATFLRAHDGGSDQHDVRLRRKDGTELWALLTATALIDAEGTCVGTLVMVTDITSRKAAEEQLAHQALHDSLTGLPNRTLFSDRLDQAVARSRRNDTWSAVLFVDLDRFKVVNDGLGHGAGDELLATVAARLRAAARPGDTVARVGGDEFVVLCEDLTDERAARGIAKRLADAVSLPIVVGDRQLEVTVSIGIAVARGGATDAETLLADADAAMYKAKQRGRARYEVFDAEMRSQVVERLDTETALRRALELDQFCVFYQPEVSLRDGTTMGVEALVRWQHPERGLLGPDAFISMAEETGLILPLGRWVLTEACRQLQAWRSAHPELSSLVVWVNLSAQQLTEAHITEVVSSALAETGLEPANLGLEITESAVMDDIDAVGRALAGLKALGVQLAVDDFGTGFSSLTYLKEFPVDVLKVDRSFVAGLGHDAGDSAIVAAVIGLARSLGLDAVAEGVETFEQLAALHALGCSGAQGYYLGRPEPAGVVQDMLFRRPVQVSTGVRSIALEARSPAPSGAATVVVCDDDPVLRDAYRAAFEAAGATVFEAGDGDECLVTAARHLPDVVLVDAVMPKRDGLSVIGELRERHPDTTIVLVTAFGGPELQQRGRDLGAHASVQKADLLSRLDEAVDALLHRSAPAVRGLV